MGCISLLRRSDQLKTLTRDPGGQFDQIRSLSTNPDPVEEITPLPADPDLSIS